MLGEERLARLTLRAPPFPLPSNKIENHRLDCLRAEPLAMLGRYEVRVGTVAVERRSQIQRRKQISSKGSSLGIGGMTRSVPRRAGDRKDGRAKGS